MFGWKILIVSKILMRTQTSIWKACFCASCTISCHMNAKKNLRQHAVPQCGIRQKWQPSQHLCCSRLNWCFSKGWRTPGTEGGNGCCVCMWGGEQKGRRNSAVAQIFSNLFCLFTPRLSGFRKKLLLLCPLRKIKCLKKKKKRTKNTSSTQSEDRVHKSITEMSYQPG